MVTIDGIRMSEFLQWNQRLLQWTDSLGAYLPYVYNETRGKTDPNHTILFGCGDPGFCNNMEGHPANPMLPELLRHQRGYPESAVVIVSGKWHLLAATIYSQHPDYGIAFQACTLYVKSPPIPCLCLPVYEGPDSLIMARAISHLNENDVKWMGINLSEYDFLAHIQGMQCCEFDTACYWDRLKTVYEEAEHQIIDVLWPFLQSHCYYSGKTLLVICTDHGRHLDDVEQGFLDHGHGWLPGHLECAQNCSGCRDIWAIFIGPGILRGITSSNTYAIEDIAPTIRYLMGFDNPFEEGLPIEEIIDEDTSRSSLSRLAQNLLIMEPGRPNPFYSSTTVRYLVPQALPIEVRIYDVQGRQIWTSGLTRQSTGWHNFTWYGEDENCGMAPPGIYYLGFHSEQKYQAQKLTLLR
ncbi:MAG: T9SS type A sorting domain-containing protein [Candidatus Eisenbacteria bacterium]|nr:T9SS type A sorting domain-containing protein [Candidatus Eisenbacteria bacterium]MBU1949058.1 T9SS type A sorting domain-containing protein [Candidatus Eisenbacteria bacterium]